MNSLALDVHSLEVVPLFIRLLQTLLCISLCFVLAACGASAPASDVDGPTSSDSPSGAGVGVSQSDDDRQTSTLTAYFLDVGQGDCEFIQLPDGKTMLIDAGDSDAAATVIDLLHDKGVSKLDYVVATHPDEDHIGSLDDVISSFDVGEVWMPNASKDTAAFNALLDAIEAKGLAVSEAKAGEKIGGDGTGYSIAVLGPPEGLRSENSNDYSVVLKVTYGATSFLFTGDATAQEIVEYAPGHVDVLKAAHHGSKTGTNAAVMEALTPSYVMLSYAEGNSYGHPDQSVLDAIADAGATAYSTAAYGNIAASSDGSKVTVTVSKQGTIAAGTSEAQRERQGSDGASASNDVTGRGTSGFSREQAESKGSGSSDATVGSTAPDDSQETVYVTATGKKYHRAGCRTISGRAVTPLTKQEAIAAGYTACEVCDP